MYAIAMCVFQCTHAVVSKVNVYRCGKMVTTHMFTYCKHGYIGCFRWICCLDSREAKRVCVLWSVQVYTVSPALVERVLQQLVLLVAEEIHRILEQIGEFSHCGALHVSLRACV